MTSVRPNVFIGKVNDSKTKQLPVFTLLLMILFVGDSLWIMTNLDYRMM